MDNAAQLRRRLQRIAAAGARNRLGLFPDATSRRWRFDPSAGPESVSICQLPAPDMSDPGRMVTDFTVKPADQAPMNIYLADPWLLIDFDHGLGGAKLLTELIAAITSDAPAFAEPEPVSDCRHPVLRAFAHSARVAPLALARAADLDRHPNQPVCSEAFDQIPEVVHTHSDPQFLQQLRTLRDRDLPGVSVSAIVTSATLLALDAVGVETDPAVGIMVDVGRYLPPGTGTLSNFTGLAPISVTPPFAASAIGEQVDGYTNGYRALTRYGMSTIAAWRRPLVKSTVKHSDDGRARLVVTDHGEPRSARKIRWAGPEESRVYIRHAPIGYSNQITLAINRIGNQLQLSASFFATEFDRATIAAALERVVESARLGRR